MENNTKKTTNPEWEEEQLHARGVIPNLHFLHRNYLTIEVFDQDSGNLIGVGIIGLKASVQAIGEKCLFSTDIILRDEYRGTISGSLQLRLTTNKSLL